MHPGLAPGCFFMKGPLSAILAITILALSSYWIITSIRKANERKEVELSVRKMALSIQLNREQEQRVLEIELDRRSRIRQIQDSLENNKKGLSAALKALSSRYTFQTEGIMDSLQKTKYNKYRKALARKKARKIRMIRKSQKTL